MLRFIATAIATAVSAIALATSAAPANAFTGDRPLQASVSSVCVGGMSAAGVSVWTDGHRARVVKVFVQEPRPVPGRAVAVKPSRVSVVPGVTSAPRFQLDGPARVTVTTRRGALLFDRWTRPAC